MPFFILMLLFDYLSLCMHTVYLSILLLCLSVCVTVITDLQAHAPCKHKELATVVNPYMVLWQKMDINQYNPLNLNEQGLLQG